MGILAADDFVFDKRLPYYLQLKSVLEEKIDRRELRPGDKLPSEAELCDKFGVSRTVVRQALKDMEYEGLIIKKKGKGAFISEPKILESFVQQLTGFHQDMAAQKRSTRSTVIELDTISCSRRITKILGLRSNARVVLLKRLRFVDDDPIQLVSSYIPYRLCPELLSADFRSQSLYHFLEERGIFLARGYRTIEAVGATAEEASHLGLEPGSPTIRIESIGYTAEGTPVEYYEAVHRGDRTRFRVELVRKRVRKTGDSRGQSIPADPTLFGIEVLPTTIPESTSKRSKSKKRR